MSRQVSPPAKTAQDDARSDPSCSRDRRDVNDSFFHKGYQLVWRDQGSVAIYYFDDANSTPARALSRQEGETSHKPQYPCGVIGCSLVFDSFVDCDAHYEESHIFQCRECHAILPSDRLLDLHLQEAHDSFFAAAVDRGRAKYACLVCYQEFGSVQDRLAHLMECHRYPKWFRFIPKALFNEEVVQQKKHKWTKNHSKCKKENQMEEEPDLEKRKRRERQKQKRSTIPCKFFASKGGCWRGDKCVFLHTTSMEVLTDQLATMTVPDKISFGRKRS
jgi:hypothetical protein